MTEFLTYRADDDDLEPLIVRFERKLPAQDEGRDGEVARKRLFMAEGQRLGQLIVAHVPNGLVDHMFAFLALHQASLRGLAFVPPQAAAQYAVQTAIGTFQLEAAWDESGIDFWRNVIESALGDFAPTMAADAEAWAAFQDVVMRLAGGDKKVAQIVNDVQGVLEDPHAVHPESIYPRLALAIIRITEGEA